MCSGRLLVKRGRRACEGSTRDPSACRFAFRPAPFRLPPWFKQGNTGVPLAVDKAFFFARAGSVSGGEAHAGR
jgi:hypothetical protein